MAADFGTEKYLATVWAQCNRHDDACDGCDECAHFDPHFHPYPVPVPVPGLVPVPVPLPVPPRCAHFDPHCPATCGAKRLSGHVDDCSPPKELNAIQKLHLAPDSADCSGCDFCHGCPDWCGTQLAECPDAALEPWRYISLYLPISPCISLHLPISPRCRPRAV